MNNLVKRAQRRDADAFTELWMNPANLFMMTVPGQRKLPTEV